MEKKLVNELTEIKENSRRNSEALQKNTELLQRLEVAIIGDEKTGIKGLVNMVKEHDTAINGFKNDRTKVVAGSMVLATIIGFLTNLFSGHK